MGSPMKLMVHAPLEPMVLSGIVLGPRYSQLAPLASSLTQPVGMPLLKFSCQTMVSCPVVKKYNVIKERVRNELNVVFMIERLGYGENKIFLLQAIDTKSNAFVFINLAHY